MGMSLQVGTLELCTEKGSLLSIRDVFWCLVSVPWVSVALWLIPGRTASVPHKSGATQDAGPLS